MQHHQLMAALSLFLFHRPLVLLSPESMKPDDDKKEEENSRGRFVSLKRGHGVDVCSRADLTGHLKSHQSFNHIFPVIHVPSNEKSQRLPAVLHLISILHTSPPGGTRSLFDGTAVVSNELICLRLMSRVGGGRPLTVAPSAAAKRFVDAPLRLRLIRR